jgi:hypothetical protein
LRINPKIHWPGSTIDPAKSCPLALLALSKPHPGNEQVFSELDRGSARAPMMDITAEHPGVRQRSSSLTHCSVLP